MRTSALALLSLALISTVDMSAAPRGAPTEQRQSVAVDHGPAYAGLQAYVVQPMEVVAIEYVSTETTIQHSEYLAGGSAQTVSAPEVAMGQIDRCGSYTIVSNNNPPNLTVVSPRKTYEASDAMNLRVPISRGEIHRLAHPPRN